MIESIYVARKKPWEGLGNKVDGVLTSKDALVQAGLDWKVNPRPVMVDGEVCKNYIANVRDKDSKVLGIVSEKYQIVQNEDAFAFTDELLRREDVRYESAGAFAGGKKVWLLAKMPSFKVLNDDVDCYVVFTNSFNGTGAVRVAVTPIRVVCNNALNLAFRHSKRSWSVRHVGESIMSRISEAQESLDFTRRYVKGLQIEAERLSQIRVSQDRIDKALGNVFPTLNVIVTEDTPKYQIERNEKIRGTFLQCYNAPDLANFKGTAWGAVNAMADYVTHATPFRETKTYEENRCARIFEGHYMLDKFTELIAAA